MTEEEEQRIREKCREVWMLNKEQTDYYIYKCKQLEEDPDDGKEPPEVLGLRPC